MVDMPQNQTNQLTNQQLHRDSISPHFVLKVTLSGKWQTQTLENIPHQKKKKKKKKKEIDIKNKKKPVDITEIM